MTDNEKKILFGVGLLGFGAFMFFSRKSLGSLAQAALDEANAEIFQLSLPSAARPYADVIRQVAREQGVDPFVLAALGVRESGWGNLLSPRGPAGTGDEGHGHGLMQIDDRTWSAWLDSADWGDPYTNVTKGAQIFRANLDQAEAAGLSGDDAVQAALGAYNRGPGAIANAVAGLGPDLGTTGGNYASDVWGKAQAMEGSFQAGLA